MNFNNFSEIRKKLLYEDNNALLLDAPDTFQQQQVEIKVSEIEKQKQLYLEKENEVKSQEEIIQQQKEKELQLTEIERQKQLNMEKENELKRQQEIIQQQKEKELQLTEIERQKQLHVEKENELKRQQEIIQQQKEIQLVEIEKQHQIEERIELSRQSENTYQQKGEEIELTEIEIQKQTKIKKESKIKEQNKQLEQQKENKNQSTEIEKQKPIQTATENQVNNNSRNILLLKVSILSIIISILICGSAFFFYTKYYEDNAIRDAKNGFNFLVEENHNYYKEKETIFKDFLQSFANSNTYNIEINSKLQNDLAGLEDKKNINIEEANKNINKLRNIYIERKGSLADFDYAYSKMVESFKNNDSINIIPIENKVNKIITLFSQQNSSNKKSTEKIKNDIINKSIFGWGKLEKVDIKSIIYNTELSDNDNYIVSINLEKNGIKSIAELTITYNNEVFSDLKTNKITFPNVAPANSWFNFTPLMNCSIQVNSYNHPISFKSCESCTPIKINSDFQNLFNLTEISQKLSITSDTNSDVIVDFTYIPK